MSTACPHRTLSFALVAVCGLFCAAAASAQTVTAVVTAPQNVVSLSASASVEVTKDWLSVSFSTSTDGAEAAMVQSKLRQALDAALAEARKVAKPGELEVQTGSFSLHPRYAPKGGINGWQGTAELLVQGRDAQAIAQLTGRIQSLSIARVGYSLSRAAREKVEADVAAQAVGRFRERAQAMARQFGFAGYTLREVTVSTNEPPSGAYPMMQARMAAAPPAEAALPVEAGKATVTTSVSGSVQLQLQ